MADITSFSGQSLLQQGTVDAIVREAETIVAHTNVALAWKASGHLKKELSALGQEAVKPVLPAYRRVTAKLKALSLPLLDADEVKNLLQNNLAFLEAKDQARLAAGLSAWLAVQDDAEREALKREFSALAPALFLPPGPYERGEQEELADHAALAEHVSSSASAVAPDAVAEKLISFAGGGDKETFLRRATALATSRLRDVRTAAQIAEYIRRPLAVGGLGLAEPQAEQAEQIIESAYQTVHKGEAHAPTQQPEPVAPLAAQKPERMSAPLPVAAPKPASVPVSAPQKPLPVVTAPVPVLVKPKPMPAPVPAAIPEKVMPEKAPILAPVMRRSIRPATNNAESKRRLDDITTSAKPAAAPKTVGPAQELGTLTIADFRGFGDARAAEEHILASAKRASETLADKLSAVAAFRASELFRQYVAIGRASLSQGKKLAEVLADSSLNPNAMTQDEFFSIASLNNKLQ